MSIHLRRARPSPTGFQCAACGARNQSVCVAVRDGDLSTLAAAAARVELERGQVFIHEGQPAEAFFNITAGTVKLFKLMPDGRQQITGFASAGYFLGLAVSRSYAFSAEAIEPVRACCFSRPRLQQLLRDLPRLEHRLLEVACNELAAAQEQILLLGRKTACERVASFLASLHGADPNGEADRVHLPMTRGEIADYLGLTIETVSRTLSRFKAAGKIAVPSRDVIVLLDRPWLEQLAAGAI